MGIRADNLGKFYRMAGGARHWVLRNVNFEIPKGKSVALLGPNGAGKSTLLRLLGGVEPASEGSVHIDGSVSWPVGLAGGFHMALSARDNCRFVLRIHGVREPVLSQKLKQIRDFSEIGKFFENPMQTYSSGMRSRVAFALSMSLDFDFYLIDEITAVGDAAFRDKSKAELLSKKSSAAFILATHNLAEAVALADYGLLVHDGVVRLFTDVQSAADAYRLIAFPDSLFAQRLRETQINTQPE